MASENARLVAEQERIARELQEDAVHVLFGIGLELQSIAQDLSEEPTTSRVEGLVATLDSAISDLRAAVFGLGHGEPNEHELG